MAEQGKRGGVKERDVVIPPSCMRKHSRANSPPSDPIWSAAQPAVTLGLQSRAGSNKQRETWWNTLRTVRKVWKGGVKNVARVGKCTKHNDTKQTNDEMIWNALTTMWKAPQQAATHWQKYSKLDWDVTAAFWVTDRSKIQQKFIQCADLVSWMGMVLTA